MLRMFSISIYCVLEFSFNLHKTKKKKIKINSFLPTERV